MDNTPNYIVNDKGVRELDYDSKVQMQEKYFELGGLTPFKLDVNVRSKLGFFLKDNIKDLKEPTLIACKGSCENDICALLLLIINKQGLGGISYKKINLEYLVNNIFENYQANEELDNYQVLFVTLGTVTTPHMYNAYSMVNIAKDRQQKGKYTFFIFDGSLSDLAEPKWQIDINGAGSYVQDKKTESIRNHINCISVSFKKGGKADE